MIEKNMDAVKKFKNGESLKFLRGMCFNNAAILCARSIEAQENPNMIGRISNDEKSERVFKLARKLFDEAIKVKFNEWEDE